MHGRNAFDFSPFRARILTAFLIILVFFPRATRADDPQSGVADALLQSIGKLQSDPANLDRAIEELSRRATEARAKAESAAGAEERARAQSRLRAIEGAIRSLEVLKPAPAAPLPDALAARAVDLLSQNCFSCHGPQKQKSDLRLDSREAILKGGTDGPAMISGDPERSLLIRAIRQTGDLKMPPKGKLPDEAIELLADWIRSGAT
ncbi:c-type cytochrome, partial [Candidatus Sumerlaeota bacterium]|nr:c-type cytochrome [Candidatus Sumerlaeota bacterium]